MNLVGFLYAIIIRAQVPCQKVLKSQSARYNFMVIYIDVRTKRKLSVESLNSQLKDLGARAAFTYEGKVKRGDYTKHIWHHKKFQGGLELGEILDEKLIYASAKSASDEERLASSWIEWMIRHFHRKISGIEITLEYAKVGEE